MMRGLILAAVLAVALGTDYNATYNASPIWKVFCPNYIYHGRVDSLVNPGNYSGHIHKVFGGNHFSASKQERSFMQVYGITRRSTCTSCSLREVDNSNYWTSDLYYQWPNGSLSLVPNSGLTVYYLSRGGSTGANRTNPNWQPIPRGLRMLAGNTLRRAPDNSSDSKAVSYYCLTDYNVQAPLEQQTFPTKDNFCKNGLRAQVWFPMCWNGKDLDSADHKSHMHYPLNYDNNPQGGDCPNSHPVRIPGIFVEHIYSVDQFPHGDGTRQPFVWSNGDQNGNGFHADFVSAWVPEVMAAAIAHPNCSNDNPLMAFGNRVDQCPPLAPFVKDNYGSNVDCQLSHLMPTTENLG
ncbi:putative WSC domain protein, partial [Planoprotostelium fungivorum]